MRKKEERWNKKDTYKLWALLADGLTIEEIARSMGRPKGNVDNYIQRAGIPVMQVRNTLTRIFMHKLYSDGVKPLEVAESGKHCYRTAMKYHETWKPNKGHLLDREDSQLATSWYVAGAGVPSIAKILSVPANIVRMALRDSGVYKGCSGDTKINNLKAGLVDDRIVRLHRSGMSTTDIIKRLGLEHSHAKRYIEGLLRDGTLSPKENTRDYVAIPLINKHQPCFGCCFDKRGECKCNVKEIKKTKCLNEFGKRIVWRIM